jgi:hypothetical protein
MSEEYMELSETTYLAPPAATDVSLFTRKAITVAAGLGGPLAGVYLIARNFRSLGNADASRSTIALGAILTFLFLTAVAFIPEPAMDRIPRSVLPLAEGGVFYLVVGAYQQKEIESHLKAGGKKGSWRVIVAASVLSLILSMAFLLVVYVSVPHEDTTFKGTPYTFASTGCTIYHDAGSIQEPDLKAVGALLEEAGYFTRDTRQPAGLREENGDYVLELEVDKSIWEQKELKADIAHLVYRLNNPNTGHYYHVRCVSVNFLGDKTEKMFLH